MGRLAEPLIMHEHFSSSLPHVNKINLKSVTESLTEDWAPGSLCWLDNWVLCVANWTQTAKLFALLLGDVAIVMG